MDKQHQIQFLKDFLDFQYKYPDIHICLDSEYTNGFYVDGGEISSELLHQYYWNNCTVSGCKNKKEWGKFLCEQHKEGCVICHKEYGHGHDRLFMLSCGKASCVYDECTYKHNNHYLLHCKTCKICLDYLIAQVKDPKNKQERIDLVMNAKEVV